MTNRLLLIAFLAGSLAPVSSAFAHFGLAGDEDVGHVLFWFYGLLLAGITGYVIYRKWWRAKVTPEHRALKRRLNEFERALTSCRTQLQNAEDYPKECGLTDLQRRERQESIESIQGKIVEIKLDLAVT